ncbi:DeoR/GlpR transcriptional regulator [Bacillus cytotoxicus]|nr:DeoR/GlpR family DNA-binding transcription regulator [Bacillus cytotoxicus]AWC29304.1 DeoR/GlpR transcriptional regulator [Bacillus cytotoxicus]AWC41430.1 DeoR/GlpR transcriptional regulator [Bacillus cytotoxicus]AWC49361.1 DeoR/GlpR transcriptional regulator [Bacillus cytotoxicus]AWC53376.1 DeoR/GlpR transcriptional regulator [Bacillus cytotoxicus]AWC57503.1 DeoR/GlpR transcriptional regulator [Bacillus cytotoxicus]
MFLVDLCEGFYYTVIKEEVNDMLTPERHQLILKLVKEYNVVKLQELVERTKSSESTIRRDLAQLEKQRLLKRVHGGASVLSGKGQEPTMIEKSTKNIQEKRAIASLAASLVEKGDCIYLDAGSTTFEMIPYLINKDVTVVTNGLMHIEALVENHIRAYLLGGMMKSQTKALIGAMAQESMQKYRFDKCFLGANGVHEQLGYTTPDPEEALLKKMALTLANEGYFLVDESKFSEVAFAKIANIEDAKMITNALEEIEEYRKKTNVIEVDKS